MLDHFFNLTNKLDLIDEHQYVLIINKNYIHETISDNIKTTWRKLSDAKYLSTKVLKYVLIYFLGT